MITQHFSGRHTLWSLLLCFKNPLKPLSEPPSLYNLPCTPSLSSVTSQSRRTLELRLGAEEAFPSGLNTPSSMDLSAANCTRFQFGLDFLASMFSIPRLMKYTFHSYLKSSVSFPQVYSHQNYSPKAPNELSPLAKSRSPTKCKEPLDTFFQTRKD